MKLDNGRMLENEFDDGNPIELMSILPELKWSEELTAEVKEFQR